MHTLQQHSAVLRKTRKTMEIFFVCYRLENITVCGTYFFSYLPSRFPRGKPHFLESGRQIGYNRLRPVRRSLSFFVRLRLTMIGLRIYWRLSTTSRFDTMQCPDGASTFLLQLNRLRGVECVLHNQICHSTLISLFSAKHH